MRVCSQPGCPKLIPKPGRCPEHVRAHEQRRGTRTERGYGYDHVVRRKQLASTVATGTVKCWRCGELISPGDQWDLGHDDNDRTRYRGPEHTQCNRATASRRNEPR